MKFRFDGGTIVLEGEGASDIASELPGMQWDARIGAHRAPAWRWSEIRARFLRTAGQLSEQPDAWVDSEPGRSDICKTLVQTTSVGGDWQGSPLRPYQESALLAWEIAGRRGTVVLPTGSGKTRVALGALANCRQSAICLVPTRVLLDQWHREVTNAWKGPVGRLGDGSTTVETITISTFESAYRQMARIGNRFELLIVDEAHHFGSGVRDEALEMSIASCRLGLTATPPPPRSMARIAELIGPVVYEQSISDLAGRFLAPFETFRLQIPLTFDEQRRYAALMSRFRDVYVAFQRMAPGATWESFLGHAMRTVDGRAAVCAWRDARTMVSYTEGKRAAVGRLLALHRGSRVLVFTGSNASAYAIAREHLVMPVTCDIDRKERAEVLDRFRKRELGVLVSAKVLNEGIDVPDADVAIVVSGTQGEREHVQRIGRVLRPGEGKRALVYELVAAGTRDVARPGMGRLNASRATSAAAS